MSRFEVVSEYKPSGDQPEAIAALSQGIEMGLDDQVIAYFPEKLDAPPTDWQKKFWPASACSHQI